MIIENKQIFGSAEKFARSSLFGQHEAFVKAESRNIIYWFLTINTSQGPLEYMKVVYRMTQQVFLFVYNK